MIIDKNVKGYCETCEIENVPTNIYIDGTYLIIEYQCSDCQHYRRNIYEYENDQEQ